MSNSKNISIEPGTQVVIEIGKHPVTSAGFINVLDINAGTVKPIHPDSLRKIIENNSYKEKPPKKVIRIGRIPFSEFILDISYEATSLDMKVVAFVKRGIFNMHTDHGVFKHIEYPSLLFVFTIVNQSIRGTQCVALKVNSPEEITDDTPIYIYPFLHVNSQTFSVCWGNIVLPTIYSLSDLQIVPGLFLNSMNVMGHYNGLERMLALLSQLQSKSICIDEALKPADICFRDFCDQYLNH